MSPIEAQIDQLRHEIRDLRAEEPGLEIERKRKELRLLQERGAKVMEIRSRAQLQLEPGEGYRLLARAESLLER